LSRSPSQPPSADSELWDPPPPWWRRRLGITALVVALALIGTGGYLWLRPADTRCGDGVARVGSGPGRQCVGLTDGGYSFAPDLDRLSALVRAENQRVAKSTASGGAPWVGIVYLMSMVPGPGSTNTADSIRHELEGAYTAQWEANHSHGQGDSPQIKLFLAHLGQTTQQRDATLDQITAHRRTDHIVAVAGLGTSTVATRSSIERLTKQDLAAFGSVLSADDLADIKGLVRVAPPNSDEAAAAAKYLVKHYRKAHVLLVQDTRDDDLYTRTLAASFRRSYPASLLIDHPMQYDSSKSDVSTYFTQQMANLCLDRPPVVYFAGRGVDLPRFLAPLAHRSCDDSPVTVISGDDASQVGQSKGVDEVKQALRLGNIKLLYTGLAHPGAWKLRPQSFDPNAIAPFQPGGRFDAAFPGEPLDDGEAIMGYDAVLTAVTAIRTAASGGTASRTPTGQDVVQMLTLLYGARAVSGASGLISLDPSGGPRDKAIPIVELDPDGTLRTVDVSSRDGTPPNAHPVTPGT
jgi:ABC-type branched-subunit amino acid transport system substrate-binding protein